MTQSLAKSQLKNICHTMQEVVQNAINAFMDPNVADNDVLTALQTAGSACVAAVGTLPQFYGSYGIYFNDVAGTTLSDGGASLVNAIIVAPGAFQFSGYVNDVGPFNLRDRLEAIVSAIQYYSAQIDWQEENHINAGTPGFPSQTQMQRVTVTLSPE